MLSTLERARNVAAATISTVSTKAVHLANLPRPFSPSYAPLRGLHLFVLRVRQAHSAEEEDEVINEELIKISSGFRKPPIDSYFKKKSLLKLLFMFLLGRKISFGHLEALSLLSSNVFSEKQAGYVFVSMLHDPGRDTNSLLIQSIKLDLESENLLHVHLALKCVANIATTELASEFFSHILAFIDNSCAPDHIVQSAILCLLRFIKLTGSSSQCIGMAEKILRLVGNANLGIVLVSTILLEELVKVEPAVKREEIMRVMATELWRIAGALRPGLLEYEYKGLPAPWHIVKILRLFHQFETPNDPFTKNLMNKALTAIMEKIRGLSVGQTGMHANNIGYAVLYEAICVSINMDHQEVCCHAKSIAGRLLDHGAANHKHLALAVLRQLTHSQSYDDSFEGCDRKAIARLRHETDLSIKRAAAEFLMGICQESNVKDIVDELLSFMGQSDPNARSALALQIATIAELWASDSLWFVETLINLIIIGGNELNGQMTNKVVNVILAKPEIQTHAANIIFQALQTCRFPHENLIRVGGIVLGEFGRVTTGNGITAVELQELRRVFQVGNAGCQAMLLTTFMKLGVRYPDLRASIKNIFSEYSSSNVLDIQQRAVEYLEMSKFFSEDRLLEIFGGLPPLLNEDQMSFLTDSTVPEQKQSGNASSGDPTMPEESKIDENWFLTHDKGVLLDGNSIRVSVDCTFDGGTGIVNITYESKSSNEFRLLKTALCHVDTKLRLKYEELPTTTHDGVIKQRHTVECLGVFETQPKLDVEFSLDGARSDLVLTLPIFVHKFFQPTSLTKIEYEERWNTLACRSVSSEKTFSINSIGVDGMKSILRMLNLAILEGVDHDPDAISGAALFNQAAALTGLLLKMEPVASHVFQLIVRSPDAALSRGLVALVEPNLLPSESNSAMY